MTAEPQPTAEQRQQAVEAGTSVAQAANTAAENSPTPQEARENASTAARQEARRQGLEITEEQANMIATMVVNQMEARGAFEPPPDPVMPPPQAQPAAARSADEPQPPAQQQAPQKRTFAQKFLGE